MIPSFFSELYLHLYICCFPFLFVTVFPGILKFSPSVCSIPCSSSTISGLSSFVTSREKALICSLLDQLSAVLLLTSSPSPHDIPCVVWSCTQADITHLSLLSSAALCTSKSLGFFEDGFQAFGFWLVSTTQAFSQLWRDEFTFLAILISLTFNH